MTSVAERRLQEITRIEREIEGLEDYGFELELCSRAVSLWSRPLKKLNLFLTVRHLRRQISHLELRRRMAYACYERVRRREDETLPSGRVSPGALS